MKPTLASLAMAAVWDQPYLKFFLEGRPIPRYQWAFEIDPSGFPYCVHVPPRFAKSESAGTLTIGQLEESIRRYRQAFERSPSFDVPEGLAD